MSAPSSSSSSSNCFTECVEACEDILDVCLEAVVPAPLQFLVKPVEERIHTSLYRLSTTNLSPPQLLVGPPSRNPSPARNARSSLTSSTSSSLPTNLEPLTSVPEDKSITSTIRPIHKWCQCLLHSPEHTQLCLHALDQLCPALAILLESDPTETIDLAKHTCPDCEDNPNLWGEESSVMPDQ